MSRAVQELTQIPFAYLIGAPLKAAIEAQALAAQSTIEFIHKVGFKQDLQTEGDLVFANPAADADAGEIRNVTFRYRKKDADDTEKSFELSVPLLSIAPIPYLRIDEVTIDFKAKLTDSIERKTNTSFQLQNSVSGKYSAFWSPIKLEFRVSSTFNTSSSTQASQRREYSMDIHVRAVQDEMPAGLSKVLDILEKSVKETPKP